MASETKARFQFSLKRMLVILTVVGISIAVLAQLFFHNFQLFQVVLGVSCTIVPFILALATIIRIAVRSKQRGLLLWGILLGVLPLIGSAVQVILLTVNGPSSNGMGMLSNQQLIQNRLPSDFDTPTVWRELERRVSNGTLPPSDADAAILAFTKHLQKTHPQGVKSPLSWQKDFIEQSRLAGLVSDEAGIALCDAYFGDVATFAQLNNQGGSPLRIQIQHGPAWDDNSHTGLGVSYLWNVVRVTVDGEEVEIDRPRRFAQRWTGRTKSNLPADATTITAELEIAYVDSDKMIGLHDDNLARSRWPKPKKLRTKIISMPLDGSDPNKPVPKPIQLLTDPTRNPAGNIALERLVVQRDEGGLGMIVAKLNIKQGLAIPVSFDVFVEYQDEEHFLGTTWARGVKNRLMTSNTSVQSNGHRIPAEVRAADLILKPNSEHIGKASGHDNEVLPPTEIWGKTIKFRSVVLERIDLE